MTNFQPYSSRKKKRAQINIIRNERRKITTDTKGKRIIRKYFEQLYANELDNLHEVDKFLGTYNLPKLNKKESENLNRQITTNEIEATIKSRTTNKSLGPNGFTGEFYKHSEKNKHLSFSNYFIKFKRREGCQAHFMRLALS